MKTILLRASTIIFLLLFMGFSKPVIEGQVVDDLGEPVQEATIIIKKTRLSTKTDSEGKYSISFIPGGIELMVSKTGYVSDSLSLNISESTKYPAENIVLYKIPSILLESPKVSSETVMGKWFTIEAKTDRPANVFLNGNKLLLDNDNSFNAQVSLRFGENNFKIDVTPLNSSEVNSINISIIRQMFPAEKEYHKALLSKKTIYSGETTKAYFERQTKLLVAANEGNTTNWRKRIIKIYDMQEDRDISKDIIGLEKIFPLNLFFFVSPDKKYLLIRGHRKTTKGYNPDRTNFIFSIEDWKLSKIVDNAPRKNVVKTLEKTGLIITEKERGSALFITKVNSISEIWNRHIAEEDYQEHGFYYLEASYYYYPFAISPDEKYLALKPSGSAKKVGQIKIINVANPLKMNMLKWRYPREWEKIELKYGIAKSTKLTKSEITAICFVSESSLLVGTSSGDILFLKLNNMSPYIHNRIHFGKNRINSIDLINNDKILIVGTAKTCNIYDYPSLNRKMVLPYEIRRLTEIGESAFMFLNNDGIFVQTLINIDWNLIDNYYELKKNDVI